MNKDAFCYDPFSNDLLNILLHYFWSSENTLESGINIGVHLLIFGKICRKKIENDDNAWLM